MTKRTTTRTSSVSCKKLHAVAHNDPMAKKRAAAKKRKSPTAKKSARIVMTREEFERTDPMRRADFDFENAEFVVRGFPPSLRALTGEEVSEMRHHIVRDSVGAAHRLLVEVKRLRSVLGDR